MDIIYIYRVLLLNTKLISNMASSDCKQNAEYPAAVIQYIQYSYISRYVISPMRTHAVSLKCIDLKSVSFYECQIWSVI